MTSQEHYKNWYQRNLISARAQKTALMRKYRSENPEKHRAISRAAKKRLKDKVFGLYGNERNSDVSAWWMDKNRVTFWFDRAHRVRESLFNRSLDVEEAMDRHQCT